MQARRMKVVHILEGFSGGTRTYMCHVLPELVRRGLDVTLICSLERGGADVLPSVAKLRDDGVRVFIVPMAREIRPWQDARSLARIWRLLLQGRYDIVHTHCSKAGALGRLAACLAGVKIRLHSAHCFAFLRCDGRARRFLYMALERLFGRLTTTLVAVGESEAATAVRRRIVPSCRCVKVSNGLPPDQTASRPDPAAIAEYRRSFGLDADARVVTTVCRLVEYKGIFRFLRAAELSQVPATTFVIAGDGDLYGPAQQFIEAAHLRRKVRLLGHVDHMEPLYCVSDVMVLCSDAEAEPYAILEAMRANVPVVATATPGNNQLISHQRTGLLTDSTPAGIASAIDRVLTNHEMRRRYCANAYDYVVQQHTLDQQVSQLSLLYTRLFRRS
jgi:glycosyltransferase involved in cell wall biosynthesis